MLAEVLDQFAGLSPSEERGKSTTSKFFALLTLGYGLYIAFVYFHFRAQLMFSDR